MQRPEYCRVQFVSRKVSDSFYIDIKSFFDEVDHELLMKAVERHVPEAWVKIYIGRWLESPAQQSDRTLIQNEGQGTPQGVVHSCKNRNPYTQLNSN